ncbi:MAG UNVERIFIED_CONTAM: hypothetical protein LVR29_01730 [Microcystis novacekii LVE1205-3]
MRLGRAYEELPALGQSWKIPVVTAWNAHDLIWNDHPYYIGTARTIEIALAILRFKILISC